MFKETEALNRCKQLQKSVELEKEVRKKKYIISGDIYYALCELFNSTKDNIEFYAGVLKGLILAQGVQELDSIDKIETKITL